MLTLIELLSLRTDYEGKQWLCVGEKEVFETDKLYLPRQIRDRLRWAGQAESLGDMLIAAGIFRLRYTDGLGAWHLVQLAVVNAQLAEKKPENQLAKVKTDKSFFRHYLNKRLKTTTI